MIFVAWFEFNILKIRTDWPFIFVGCLIIYGFLTVSRQMSHRIIHRCRHSPSSQCGLYAKPWIDQRCFGGYTLVKSISVMVGFSMYKPCDAWLEDLVCTWDCMKVEDAYLFLPWTLKWTEMSIKRYLLLNKQTKKEKSVKISEGNQTFRERNSLEDLILLWAYILLLGPDGWWEETSLSPPSLLSLHLDKSLTFLLNLPTTIKSAQ